MKAHIVGGGFGGLAAAAYCIRNAGLSGRDITIYEAGETLGRLFERLHRQALHGKFDHLWQ